MPGAPRRGAEHGPHPERTDHKCHKARPVRWIRADRAFGSAGGGWRICDRACGQWAGHGRGVPAGRPRQAVGGIARKQGRSEEHTSELQSLMRSSYAVFSLKKKTSTKLTHEKII